MNSREQEEKRFLEKRRKKKGATGDVNSPTPGVCSADSSLEHLKKFFLLYNGVQKSIIMIVISLVLVAATVSWIRTPEWIWVQFALTGGAIVVGVLALAGIYGYTVYSTYQKFSEGKLYPVNGWDNFLMKTSKDFWKGDAYAQLEIALGQNSDSTQEQRLAVHTFCKDWVNSWGIRYKASWTNGAPTDFTLSGYGLIGHIDAGKGSSFMMTRLLTQIPTLIQKIGPGQLTVAINLKGELRTNLEKDESSSLDDMMENERWRRSEEKRDHDREHGHRHD